METSFLFVFLAFTLWNCSYSLTATVSDLISKRPPVDKTSPVPPSKRAIIELEVSFEITD